MITLKLSDALDLQPSLSALLSAAIPGRVKYRLTRFADALQPEYVRFNKHRLELFKELGAPVEDKPDTYEVKDPEKIAELRKRLDEFTLEEIQLNIAPLTEEMFTDAPVEDAHLFGIRKLLS